MLIFEQMGLGHFLFKLSYLFQNQVEVLDLFLN